MSDLMKFVGGELVPLTSEDLAMFNEVIQPPPAPRRFTFLQFMALFTTAEQDAIVSSTETSVKLFLLMAAGATFIDLDDPRTAQGMADLVTFGLISQDRHDAVMATQAPA